MSRPGLLVHQHYIVLVLPFRHRLSGKKAAKTVRGVDGPWKHWWSRFDDQGLQRILDDTYFFLPHVREMMFPETGLFTVGDAATKLEEARRLQDKPLAELVKQLGGDPVLRLTATKDLLEPLQSGHVSLQHGNQHFANIAVDWADVVLFPQSVGLLTLKVRLVAKNLTTDTLSDALYYLYPIHQLTLGWEFAEWQPGGWKQSFPSRDLVDALLMDIAEVPGMRAACAPATLRERLDRLNCPSYMRYTATEMGQVYSDAFTFYVFASLKEPSTDAEAPSPFQSLDEQALFELIEAADSSDADFLPSIHTLEKMRTEESVEPWASWRGVARGSRAVFVSRSTTKFMDNVFPHNLESDYLNMWLLAMFQKTRLSMMFGELVRRNDSLYGNLRAARELWDAYMAFENKHWFSEVTNKNQGRVLYRWMQHAMETESVHDELSREVADLHDHYERKDERTIARVLYFLAVLGPPLGVLSAFIGAKRADDATWQFWTVAGCVVYVVGGIFLWVMHRWRRRG